jgi:thymidylate synthase
MMPAFAAPPPPAPRDTRQIGRLLAQNADLELENAGLRLALVEAGHRVDALQDLIDQLQAAPRRRRTPKETPC